MLNAIDQRISTLTPAEQRVGQWVRQNPEASLHIALAHLADNANVSEPTVVRFCRSMDCSGFREFKLRLAQSLADTRSRYHSDVQANDSVREIAQKVIRRSASELNSALQQVSNEALEQAVYALSHCQQILFYGVGASGIVAEDAQHKFFRLGIPCTAYTDIPTILQSAAIVDANTVVVAVSKSGNSTDLAQAAKNAKDAGARLISLTTANSFLDQCATIKLRLNSAEDTNLFTPMSSRLAQLCILDTLQVGLAVALGVEATDNLKKTKSALPT
ncbi:MAG: MurR/RpiR family transcriptional regulator [Pseudomonadales bacterium]